MVAARVQSAPLAAQEVNLGAPRSSTGSPQPALTKEATCTLEVTGLTNDPPIPVPAMAEKMHSFAQYMETSSTRSFIDSRQSHTDAPLSKFAALATTVAPITDMKARKKASNDDRLLRFRFRTHIGSAELLCGSRRKGNVAERPVRARIPVSAKTKQRLANDIETITMLSLLRPSNTRLAVGTRIPEVLAIGLRLHAKNAAIPTDIVELIAMQRKSGIVFVCVRDADFEGTKRQECAFAVRRALPGRAGHTPTFKVFVSDWKPAGEAMLDIGDPAVDSSTRCGSRYAREWTLGSASPTALDARMTRRMQAAQLTEQIDKLTRDHQRAKNPEQRNEIFTKLHKAKNQLEELRKLEA